MYSLYEDETDGERMNERTSPVGEHRMDIRVATVKSSKGACHVMMLCMCM